MARRKGTKASLIRYFAELTDAGRQTMRYRHHIPNRIGLGASALAQAEDMADFVASSGNIRRVCLAEGC